jgi:hypothetical protein
MTEDQVLSRSIKNGQGAGITLYPEIRRVERFLASLNFTDEIPERRKLLVIYLLEQMV